MTQQQLYDLYTMILNKHAIKAPTTLLDELVKVYFYARKLSDD